MYKKVFSAFMALVLIAGAGVAAMPMITGQASAGEADGTTYASVVELSNSSQTGQVDGITVATTGYVNWTNMPDDVESVNVTMKTDAGDGDNEWQTFAHKSYENVSSDRNGDYSYDRVEGDVIENTDFTADTFSAEEDGETTEQYFHVKVIVTVTAEDGTECTFTDTHKVTTEVTNLADATVGGDTAVDGTIEMNESDTHCPSC